MGSGAGFPAIPLKICKPRLKVHLLEPNRKKCSFLKQVIRVTGLRDADVLRGRIEEGRAILPETGYQVVTSRAFMPLPQTVTHCAPYLVEGGLLIYFLGKDANETLQYCRETLEAQACRVFRIIPYTLPGKASRRHVLCLVRGGGGR